MYLRGVQATRAQFLAPTCRQERSHVPWVNRQRDISCSYEPLLALTNCPLA